jgi:hypothetical protein
MIEREAPPAVEEPMLLHELKGELAGVVGMHESKDDGGRMKD